MRKHLSWILNQHRMVRDEVNEARRGGMGGVFMHRNLDLSPRTNEWRLSPLFSGLVHPGDGLRRGWVLGKHAFPTPILINRQWIGPGPAADGAPAAEQQAWRRAAADS